MNTLSLYQKSLRGTLDEAECAALEQTLQKHPYFSMGHYVRAKQDTSHEYLFVASTYSPNRSLLRLYMDGSPLLIDMDTDTPAEAHPPEKQPQTKPLHGSGSEDLFSILDFDALPHTPESPDHLFSAVLPVSGKEIDAFLETKIRIGSLKWLRLVEKIRAQIRNYAHTAPLFEPVHPLLEAKPPVEAAMLAQYNAKAEKLSLLDQFLKSRPEMPRINPEDTPTPDKAAAASILKEGEIVTEALARIPLMQGNLDEARSMYQKLCLLFPEKSDYFGAQIEKINNRI